MAVDTSNSLSYGLVPYATSGFDPSMKPGYLPDVTGGQIVAGAGLLSAYGASQAAKAAAINQQTSYLLQSRDTLAVAQVRADMSEQYAAIQAGRTLKRADMEAQNYTIAGNSLLKNMRATNASIRARAASSGVVLGEGSFQNVIGQNVQNVMQDVNIADLNALTAKVLGFEDASAMMQSSDIQNTLSLYSARGQAGQLAFAGSSARKTGGILADATLINAAVPAYKTYTD